MSWFVKPGMPFKQVSELLNRHYREIEGGGGKKFYLVCGEESFLVHRVARRLALAFTSEETSAERITVLEGDEATGAAVLRALLERRFDAMFGKRHVIIARNPVFVETAIANGATRKKAKPEQLEELSRVLTAVQSGLSDYAVLILAIDAPMSETHPAVQAAFEHGIAIFLSKLKQRELSFFIESVCKRLGMRIHHDAIGELLLRVGDDLWQINSELEKLACYVGERREITIEDVREICPSLVGDVFKLAGFLVNGDVGRARSLMASLLSSREPLVRIMYMLARQYRLLLQARWLIDAGVVTKAQLALWSQDLQEHLHSKLTEAIRSRFPKGERLSLLSQHPYAIKVLLEQAASYTMDDIANALMILRDADVALKTSGMREEEIADWLVMRLCRLSRLKGNANA